MSRRTTTDPTSELSITAEQICFIIVKAKEFDALVELDDPDSGSNPTDDRDIDVLEDQGDNPTLQELLGAISALNSDQRSEVLALCWLGRGDYTVADWLDALREARDVQDEQLAQYLIGTPLLGDYLEEGYNQLGHSCEDYALGRL
jgi:hypothetical protein